MKEHFSNFQVSFMEMLASALLGSAAHYAGCSTKEEEIIPIFAVRINHEQRVWTHYSDK